MERWEFLVGFAVLLVSLFGSWARVAWRLATANGKLDGLERDVTKIQFETAAARSEHHAHIIQCTADKANLDNRVKNNAESIGRLDGRLSVIESRPGGP